MLNPIPQYQAAQDSESDLLALFPHRFDYLWAEHPAPDERPQWQTESKHPLSDRLIRQGAYLYGVRFSKTTNYFLIDIDKNSAYHPSRDPLAIQRLCGALEKIGAVSYVAVTSSHSGGLHFYFPYTTEQKSYQIGRVVQAIAQNAGFKVKPGQLEIFPNPRPYQEKLSLYAGHRLPLQLGSYLLNGDFAPVFTTESGFVQQWKLAQARNDVSTETIEQVWRVAQRHERSMTSNAAKFLNDLDAEIEPGWTGHGQTNWILGKLADREFIFRHVLSGGEPLKGEALVKAMLGIVPTLPGYKEFCRHQHDIEQRIRDWARCVEKHRYHYGGTKEKLVRHSTADLIDESTDESPDSTEPSKPNQNLLKAENTQQRIREAVADLVAKNELPSTITARRKAIAGYGISPTTLTKYRSLWHPAELDHTPEKQAENAPVEETPESLPDEGVHTLALNKVLDAPAAPLEQAGISQPDGGGSGGTFIQSDLKVEEKEAKGNFVPPDLKQKILDSIARGKPRPVVGLSPEVLLQKAKREKRVEADRETRLKRWLESSDPILVREARKQLGLPDPPD